MKTYFAVGQGVRNVDWDWSDDSRDVWLHMAREALKPTPQGGLSNDQLRSYCAIHSKRMRDEGFAKTAWLIDVLEQRLL